MTFIRNFEDCQLLDLRKKSHKYEKIGISYWCSRLGVEVTELDLVRVKVKSLKEQVLEVVSSNLLN